MDKLLLFLEGGVIGFITGRHLINKHREKIYTSLQQILKLSIMSDQNLQELLQKVSGLRTSVTNIAADITRIKENLPTSGGLSEAEVATLKAELDGVSSQADALDKENEETTEPPVEG